MAREIILSIRIDNKTYLIHCIIRGHMATMCEKGVCGIFLQVVVILIKELKFINVNEPG